MFSQRRKARVLFGLSDIILATSAFAAAYRTRAVLHLHFVFYLTLEQKALLLGFGLFAFVTVGLWLGVYERLDPGDPRVVFSDAARQCACTGLGMVVFQYSLRMDLSRFFIVLFCAYACLLVVIFRLVAGRIAGIVRREFGVPHYVMVVGTGAAAMRIARTLEQSEKYGVRLCGFLAGDSTSTPAEIAIAGRYKVQPISDLAEILRRRVVDEIIFAVDSARLAGLDHIFQLCDEEGVRTRVALDFFPHANSKMSLEHLGATPLLTFSASPYDEIRLLLKRAIDIVVAGLGLLMLAPLLPIVALLIRVTSPGPVIFRQVRCGLNGRRFTLYKFRSMCADAEALKPSLAHLSTRQTAFKLPRDPRLTLVGRYLRKFSIDECPQLWNVLRGDMSLVGPRPAIPEEVDQYQMWQRRRLRVRPGLTCLWAISGRDHVDFETWMRLDLRYIDTWSLGLDWRILLRTIPRVLSGRGAC